MAASAATATYLTLYDWAKREKPGGGIAEIIEVLVNSNPIIADANVMEGNLPTGHRSVQRTTDPAGTWRLLNKGVAAEKSTTKQMDDTCGVPATGVIRQVAGAWQNVPGHAFNHAASFSQYAIDMWWDPVRNRLWVVGDSDTNWALVGYYDGVGWTNTPGAGIGDAGGSGTSYG